MEQPLEPTQSDIDDFLGNNGHIMKFHYDRFNSNGVKEKQEGWNGIYMSLRVQIDRCCKFSLDLNETEEDRATWRSKAQMIILDLCNVAIFYKEKITKAYHEDIIRLLYVLRFQHPIGEAYIESDLIFKEKIVRAIATLGRYARTL
jgi:hypothetical protein